jgi:hypothetical protein
MRRRTTMNELSIASAEPSLHGRRQVRKAVVSAYVWELLALLAMTVALTACQADSGDTSGSSGGRGAATVLQPNTSREAGISGVVPNGWEEVKPGQFQRSRGNDPALLEQLALPGATIEQIISPMQLPARVSSRETATLTWELYTAQFEWPNAGTLTLDMALSEDDAAAYLVEMVSLFDGRDTLYADVFTPAVEALEPIAMAEECTTPPPTTPLNSGPTSTNTRIRSSDGMVMVYVPAGEFEMGNIGIQWIW